MSIELRHLRVFIALAEDLHFGRAALRLRVAQSAVSSTLKSLEEEVGATLLARTRRSVALTAAGRGFLDHARRAIEETDAATSVARRAAQGETGRLSLSFTLMSALTVLPRVVTRFQQTHPEVQVSIGSGGTTEQLEAIRAGRCDVGFVTRKGSVAPLATELVEESPLVVVMAKGHALAKRRRIALGQLAGERFVFLHEASEPQVHGKFRRRCN